MLVYIQVLHVEIENGMIGFSYFFTQIEWKNRIKLLVVTVNKPLYEIWTSYRTLRRQNKFIKVLFSQSKKWNRCQNHPILVSSVKGEFFIYYCSHYCFFVFLSGFITHAYQHLKEYNLSSAFAKICAPGALTRLYQPHSVCLFCFHCIQETLGIIPQDWTPLEAARD